MSEKDRKIFAYHEAGHALIGKLIPGGDPVHKVTIVGRGLAGGYTLTLPEEDRQTRTKTDLTNYIMYGLGGRVAEEIVFGDVSTGAQNDLARISKIARRMVTEWGMSEKLGPVVFGKNEEQVFLGRDLGHVRNYSEEIASLIDSEVKGLIDECYRKTKELLSENRETLDRMVEALLEKETLNREEIDLIFEGKTIADLKKRDAELANKASEEKVAEEKSKESRDEDESKLGKPLDTERVLDGFLQDADDAGGEATSENQDQ